MYSQSNIGLSIFKSYNSDSCDGCLLVLMDAVVLIDYLQGNIIHLRDLNNLILQNKINGKNEVKVNCLSV